MTNTEENRETKNEFRKKKEEREKQKQAEAETDEKEKNRMIECKMNGLTLGNASRILFLCLSTRYAASTRGFGCFDVPAWIGVWASVN